MKFVGLIHHPSTYRRRIGRMGSFLALAALAGGARAQSLGSGLIDPTAPIVADRGRNIGVLDRPRPEYEAVGIRAGGFVIIPRLDTGLGFSDNIFGAKIKKTSDEFVHISPRLFVDSDWTQNQLALDAGADLERYFRHSIKNTSGYHLIGSGRYDISRSLSFNGGGSIQRTFEERYSGDFPTASAEAVPITTADGNGRFVFRGGRIRGLFSTDFQHLNYHDVTALDGSNIDQDYRDRGMLDVTARGEYALTPDASLFAQVSYGQTRYDEHVLSSGLINRDSRQFRVLGGATMDVTSLVRGSLGIGYVSRDFTTAVYKNIAGFAVDGRIEYFLDPLTTITLRGRRFIDDADFGTSGGYFATSGTLRVDHELLRNLLFDIQGDYQRDRYNASDRREHYFSASAGANYLVSRMIGLKLTGTHVGRRSNAGFPGSTFTENRVLVSVILQR